MFLFMGISSKHLFFTGFQCFDIAMGIRSTTIVNLEPGHDISELVWWVDLQYVPSLRVGCFYGGWVEPTNPFDVLRWSAISPTVVSFCTFVLLVGLIMCCPIFFHYMFIYFDDWLGS